MYIIVNSAYTERDKWAEGEYVYFGPFDTKEDAEKWAEAEYEHWGWWVVKLWETYDEEAMTAHLTISKMKTRYARADELAAIARVNAATPYGMAVKNKLPQHIADRVEGAMGYAKT